MLSTALNLKMWERLLEDIVNKELVKHVVNPQWVGEDSMNGSGEARKSESQWRIILELGIRRRI